MSTVPRSLTRSTFVSRSGKNDIKKVIIFSFYIQCICICLLSTKIKAVKSFPPLKVWNFTVYGHVHVLISMVCYSAETKKTRANVVFVCIFYTFFCFRFFNMFFLFVFLKFQNSKICLHFKTAG